MRFRLLLMVLLTGALCRPATGQTGTAVPEMATLDQSVTAFMQKWNVPGGAFAVTYQGRLVYARGFGLADKDTQEPVQPTSAFRIASVSKSITGIAIAKLIEDGMLAKSDVVFGPTGILQGARYDTLGDARMTAITVGDLLHHTSGIGTLTTGHDPVFADLYVEAQAGFGLPHSPEDKIEYYIKTQTLKRTPASGYEYSNMGYLILGRVIETVTGMSYADYCRTALFEPLGIETIRMGNSLLENRLPGEVKYYDVAVGNMTTSVYGTGQQVPWVYGGMNVETFDAHGGWTASAVDLVRLLTGVDGFATQPDILESATIQQMTTPTANSAGYAFGFAVNASDNWWHMGSIPGATAEWARISSGINFALVFNHRNTPALNQFNAEADAIFWNAFSGFTGWPSHDLFAEHLSNEPDDAAGRQLGLTVYPNPAGSTVRVAVSTSTAHAVVVQVGLYDALGRRLRAASTTASVSSELDFDTTEFAPGVYFVRAEDGSRVVSSTLVVAR